MIEAALPPRPKTLLGAYLKGGIFALWSRARDRTITRMDETGFTTARGRAFRWSDIAMVDRTVYTMFGADAFESVHVHVQQGELLSLPLAQAKNAPDLLAYFLRYAPRP